MSGFFLIQSFPYLTIPTRLPGHRHWSCPRHSEFSLSGPSGCSVGARYPPEPSASPEVPGAAGFRLSLLRAAPPGVGTYASYIFSDFPGSSVVRHLPAVQETQVPSVGQEDPLEKGMATHSSILAWRIHEQRSLEGCSPWGRTESDTT